MNLFDHFNLDPQTQFEKWYYEAKTGQYPNPTLFQRFTYPLYQFFRWIGGMLYPPFRLHNSDAMVLATASKDGTPSARVVLLKGIHGGRFTFYTNYNSPKAADLEVNPQVALTFHYLYPERQIRISGHVEKMSYEESNRYWLSRSRGSRFSAMVSNQSHVIQDKTAMQQAIKKLEKEYSGKEINCPDNWGGYYVTPTSYDFWQGRVNRFHDRMRYLKTETGWDRQLLAP